MHRIWPKLFIKRKKKQQTKHHENLSDQVDHNRNYNNYENSYSTP